MKSLLAMLDKVPYLPLVVVAIVAAIVPLGQPHLIEKIRMLVGGTLTRPLDIFDLFFHSFPLLVLIAKLVRDGLR